MSTEWRWLCLDCGRNGAADSAEHGLSLNRTHRMFACPAVRADDRPERIARYRLLTARYPREAPPYPRRAA